jgi:hypothetical protein
MPPLAVLISGAVLMGYLVAGLFFFRFWKETQDRLFASFAAAFWILALHRLLVSLTPREYEGRAYLYTVRLFAYLLILYAIYEKNRTTGVRDRE